MRLKKQRHRWSCGLACVAMIADKSYDTVIDDYWDQEDNEVYWKWIEEHKAWHIDYGTTTMDLHKLLYGYRINSNKRCVAYTGSLKLPDLSILVVSLRKKTINGRKETCWHWVVNERQGSRFQVYDPWNGKMFLKDCGRIESYIRIHT